MTLSKSIECTRFAVAASSSRLWRPREVVVPGQVIGMSVDGNEPVRATNVGRVSDIQYDVDRDEIILLVESM